MPYYWLLIYNLTFRTLIHAFWTWLMHFKILYYAYICSIKQGLKRLKKHQPEGRCGQTMPLESCRTDESNRNFVSTLGYKEALESASRDRFARGSTIPISIKFKKLTNEEAMSRQREHHKLARFQHEVGKSMREPPSIEIGPKRLKVRGPSFLGSESRLDWLLDYIIDEKTGWPASGAWSRAWLC